MFESVQRVQFSFSELWIVWSLYPTSWAYAQDLKQTNLKRNSAMVCLEILIFSHKTGQTFNKFLDKFLTHRLRQLRTLSRMEVVNHCTPPIMTIASRQLAKSLKSRKRPFWGIRANRTYTKSTWLSRKKSEQNSWSGDCKTRGWL